MNASMNWRREYQLLKEFVAGQPGIVLTPNEISIPQPLRDEFYRRFDDIRNALVEEHCAALPPEFAILRDSYARIENEIKELLGLDRILMPVDLITFLHNPKEGLMRAAYDRTFGLMQGKIDAGEFEVRVREDLREASMDLFRLGYEQWAALALIRRLNPEEAFFVDLDEDFKPFLRELKEISFGRQAHHPTMRIPEIALRLRGSGRYVAVKMALAKEIETYVVPFKPAVRPRKKTGDTSLVLDSRVMLLTIMERPDQIPVYADIYECTRTSPDCVVEFISGRELQLPEPLAWVRERRQALNPRLGTCLVVIDPDAASGLERVPEDFPAVYAGFDPSGLQPIVNRLALEG